jgi:hypothetical protein
VKKFLAEKDILKNLLYCFMRRKIYAVYNRMNYNAKFLKSFHDTAKIQSKCEIGKEGDFFFLSF